MQELELLEEDSNIYKLIGLVLIKQDPLEATSNVKKRLEFIQGELDRVDSAVKKLEDKQSKRHATVWLYRCMHSEARLKISKSHISFLLRACAATPNRVSGAEDSTSCCPGRSRQQRLTDTMYWVMQWVHKATPEDLHWKKLTACKAYACLLLRQSLTLASVCFVHSAQAIYAFSAVVNMSRLGMVAGVTVSSACLA